MAVSHANAPLAPSAQDVEQVVRVNSTQALSALAAHLLDERRTDPVVALAGAPDGGELPLTGAGVREIVGERARVYMVEHEALLAQLQEALGRGLALPAGAVRVWWPDLGPASDPADHPLVMALDGEESGTLQAEFARAFEITRPLVRREIRVLEDLRGIAEQRLADTSVRLRVAEQRLREAAAAAQR